MAKTILIKPLITEKAEMLSEKGNKYSFVVSKDANKIEIAKAVEKKFNVRVEDVKTMVMKGKKKSQFTRAGRFEGFRADRKKAVVKLHEDDSIDFFTAEV